MSTLYAFGVADCDFLCVCFYMKGQMLGHIRRRGDKT